MIVDTAHGHDVGEFHQPLVWPKVTAGFCREPAASVAAVSSSPSCRSAAWHLLDVLHGGAVRQQGAGACHDWCAVPGLGVAAGLAGSAGIPGHSVALSLVAHFGDTGVR
jgi:hypothetical protein